VASRSPRHNKRKRKITPEIPEPSPAISAQNEQEWIEKLRAAIQQPTLSRSQQAREFCKIHAKRLLNLLDRILARRSRSATEVKVKPATSQRTSSKSRDNAA
jgi:hypothetical protein